MNRSRHSHQQRIRSYFPFLGFLLIAKELICQSRLNQIRKTHCFRYRSCCITWEALGFDDSIYDAHASLSFDEYFSRPPSIRSRTL